MSAFASLQPLKVWVPSKQGIDLKPVNSRGPETRFEILRLREQIMGITHALRSCFVVSYPAWISSKLMASLPVMKAYCRQATEDTTRSLVTHDDGRRKFDLLLQIDSITLG